MNHTKGPWKVTEWPDERYLDGVQLTISDSRGHGLAGMTTKGRSEKVKANAKLMAAAPDLLTALKRLLIATPTTTEVKAVIPEVKAAIIKAESGE